MRLTQLVNGCMLYSKLWLKLWAQARIELMSRYRLSIIYKLAYFQWFFKVRRIGGGYGGKCFSSSLVAAACAVAAKKFNRPVRHVMDLKTNMEMFGKKMPYMTKYKVN